MIDPIKDTVKKFVDIFSKMPDPLAGLIGLIVSCQLNRLTWFFYCMGTKEGLEKIIDLDLIKALSNWNWDSHPPHTDDAILVLVEELLEEYRNEAQ